MPEHAAPLTLRHGTAADLDAVRPLWEGLYEHQAAHGMLLRVPQGAFGSWASGMAPMLGRFAVLSLAERAGTTVGFVAGRVRSLPPHFGAQLVGAIGEVFVEEASRGNGIGRRLVEHAVQWFASQAIRRVELQVVSGNPGAIRFYERLGWHLELVQLVWTANEIPVTGGGPPAARPRRDRRSR